MRLLELFSGTGSVGKAFKGCEIVSLDLDKKSKATITSDILQWDYTVFLRGHFDCIWASPPCTQYSICRTTAKTPRNLDLADSLVRRTLEIIAYFNPGVVGRESVHRPPEGARSCSGTSLSRCRLLHVRESIQKENAFLDKCGLALEAVRQVSLCGRPAFHECPKGAKSR